MEKEIWKKHNDFINYEFSNLGRYKLNGKIKKINQNNKDGYIKIKNYNTNKFCSFHRIIAELFCIKNGEDKILVDHINGLRDDNRAVNLRWVNYSENNTNRRTDGVISTKELVKTDSDIKKIDLKNYVGFLENMLDKKNKEVDFWFNAYMDIYKVNSSTI